ncbi:MAG: exo-alpha-sialidase [bacterium]|nr:exo-alpha-sialidase [bacterium]
MRSAVPHGLVVIVFIAVLLLVNRGAAAQTATLEWSAKAFGDGRHNAFTDLARWKDMYYLCFRHGEGHVSMDGVIRIMRSPDMKNWEPCGTLKTLGDDRDPHFTVTDDELFVYFGVWDLVHWPGTRTPDRGSVRSHFASTTDGTTWTEVRGLYEPGFWMWRVRMLDGSFYTAAYTAIRPSPKERDVRLLRSEDGLNWDLVSTVATGILSGESDMWIQPDGSMWMITRVNDKPGHSKLSKSDPSKKTWKHEDLGALLHSPAVAFWHDRIFVSGRGRGANGYVTKVWELVDSKLVELLTLPSSGDTAYPGLIADPASLDTDTPALFVSWYSQHQKGENPEDTTHAASVYVGRIRIEP